MTVCRYFLQGNCRFGERCRFEHTGKTHDTYDNYGGQDQYSRQYGSRNYYQQDYRYEGQSDRYGERYRTEYPARYSSSSYSNDRQQGYERDNDYYRNETSRHNSYQNKGYGHNNYNEYQRNSSGNQYTTNARYDAYGQIQYKWTNGDYRNQGRKDSSVRDYNSDYNTSTPKGEKSSFNFKVPESEIKNKSSSELTQQDQISVSIVKEDSKAWELGGLWPFTCYFPIPNKPAYPGFSDVSPEELRYAAYKAEKENNFQSYTQAVKNVLAQINHQRCQLLIPTPQLIDNLRKIWKGEDLCTNTEEVLASIPYLQYEEPGMESISSAFPVRNTAAAFSFQTATETDSALKSTAAAFSFKEPDTKSAAAAFSFKEPDTKSAVAAFSFKQPETKSGVTTAFSFKQPTDTNPSGTDEIYTPLENLTDEEKEQFRASTFVLGKIPTKPPPQVLCV